MVFHDVYRIQGVWRTSKQELIASTEKDRSRNENVLCQKDGVSVTRKMSKLSQNERHTRSQDLVLHVLPDHLDIRFLPVALCLLRESRRPSLCNLPLICPTLCYCHYPKFICFFRSWLLSPSLPQGWIDGMKMCFYTVQMFLWSLHIS